MYIYHTTNPTLLLLGIKTREILLHSAAHVYQDARCMLSHFSHVRLFAIPWTVVALLVLLSMGFSRQKYWSGLPFPPPGDLPDPGIEPKSPVSPELQADSLPLSHLGSPSICLYKHKSISRRVDKKLITVITCLVEENWKEGNIRMERRFCSLVYPHTLNYVNTLHIATIK